MVRKGKHKSKNATDSHNLDSTKPANVEPEVEIGEFDVGYLDVDTVEVQRSEWIKIGVGTGARKTSWSQSVTYGRSFLAMLTSLSAQQLENLSILVSDCTLKVATIGESIYEFEVFKRRCASHCCLLENTRRWVESLSCMVRKESSNVAKKIDAWRDLQYYGCTVA